MLTRKGYNTCATCHYNPSGGGALSSYGKYIAKEVYGFFNDSSNALPFMIEPDYEVGDFKEPWLVAQGMIRAVQVVVDSDKARTFKTNNMQLDLEFGVAQDGWQAIATVGPRLSSAIPGENEETTIDVRRWWVGRSINDYALRLGKYMPEFGIYHPHHNIPTRKGLYFNHNEEPYILQGTKFSNSFDYTLGILKGNENTKLEDKTGVVFTLAYKYSGMRYGFSALDARDDDENRELAVGVFAQVGYGQYFYLLSEVDVKDQYVIDDLVDRQLLSYTELGWEFSKATSVYFAYEYERKLDQDLFNQSPGVGVLFYPITHTELAFQVGKTYTDSGQFGEFSANRAFVMLNVYF